MMEELQELLLLAEEDGLHQNTVHSLTPPSLYSAREHALELFEQQENSK